MIGGRILHRVHPCVLDIVLGGLSIGAHLMFYSGIVEYLDGRYEFFNMLVGTPAMLLYGGMFAAHLLCIFGAPVVILVRLFWRCRKDGVWGTVIRIVILVAALSPPWLVAGPAAVGRSQEMRLRGFAARICSREADIAAIREWLETSRPPVENMVYTNCPVPQFVRVKDRSIVDCPSALKTLGPMFARVLEDGCIELEWRQRDVGTWGVIITPTEDFPQEEYRLRMEAGVYTEVCGNGETMRYKEYMIQLSPGVYAWLRA